MKYVGAGLHVCCVLLHAGSARSGGTGERERDVIAIRDAVIAENVAVIRELVDESG